MQPTILGMYVCVHVCVLGMYVCTRCVQIYSLPSVPTHEGDKPFCCVINVSLPLKMVPNRYYILNKY